MKHSGTGLILKEAKMKDKVQLRIESWIWLVFQNQARYKFIPLELAVEEALLDWIQRGIEYE